MAVAVSHAQGSNALLNYIEGTTKWSGTISINFLDASNQAELAAYQARIAPFPVTSNFLGVEGTSWEASIKSAIAMWQRIANVSVSYGQSLSADYIVGDITSAGTIAQWDFAGLSGYAGFNNNYAQVPALSISAEKGGATVADYVFLHEFGHALGLGHTHDSTNGTQSDNATSPYHQPIPFVSVYTVMSYDMTLDGRTEYQSYYADKFGGPLTPMALDIAAVQRMYGANQTTHTEGTTYRLTEPQTEDSNVAANSSEIVVGRAYYCIWDAGGEDKIVFDGNADSLIQLTAATLSTQSSPEISLLIQTLSASNGWSRLSHDTQTEISNPYYTAGGFISSILDSAGTRVAGGYTIAAGVTIENAQGGGGKDFIVGNTSKNKLEGGDGDDSLFGGAGDDTLVGGAGFDELFGGAGQDRSNYDYLGTGGANVFRAWKSASQYSADNIAIAIIGSDDDTDILNSVEDVYLTSGNDVLQVEELRLATKFHAGGQTESDALDLSLLDGAVVFEKGGIRERGFIPAMGGVLHDNTVKFDGFEVYFGTRFDDVINDPTFNGEAYLGDGNDQVRRAGTGARVHLGGGQDTVQMAMNVLIHDFGDGDSLFLGDRHLFGGLKNALQETKFASAFGGAVKYGLNEAGDLVVNVLGGDPELNSGRNLFIAGFQNTLRAGPGGSQIGAGGIILAEFKVTAAKLLSNWESHGTWMATWELFGLLMKIVTGTYGFGGGDPLVLDLDGDGFDLTALSAYSPIFDGDADLYGEHTGWVGRDDGLLARDIDGDGLISDGRELFGRGAQSGLDLLASLDGDSSGVVDSGDNGLADFNADGVIDGADTFDLLKVWRDLDQDGKADTGELSSLSQVGIVGLSVTSAASGQQVSGNLVTRTASYIRADGGSGLMGDVVMRVDNTDSTYQGTPINVTAEAAALPNLAASGTLVTLREALSLQPSGLALVQQTLDAFDPVAGHDLASLRAAVRPTLDAWLQGSPVRDANGVILIGPQPYDDVPLVRIGTQTADYAWKVESGDVQVNGETRPTITWEFATGLKVEYVGAAGETMPLFGHFTSDLGASAGGAWAPVVIDGLSRYQAVFTFAGGGVLTATNTTATPPSTLSVLMDGEGQYDGHNYTIDEAAGADIAFFERYLGEFLPFHQAPSNLNAGLAALDQFLTQAEKGLDLIAVRLAVQSQAFSGIFEDVVYDAVKDSFRPTTDHQLRATFANVGSSRVDLQACKLEYSIVSPK